LKNQEESQERPDVVAGRGPSDDEAGRVLYSYRIRSRAAVALLQ